MARELATKRQATVTVAPHASRACLVSLGLLLLTGCGPTAALLTGEAWPPQPSAFPVSAEVALAQGTAWEGGDAAVDRATVQVARTQPQWRALWAMTGRAPPRDLPDGQAAIGVFDGRGPSVRRVSTTDLRVTPARTTLDRTRIDVGYVVQTGAVSAASAGPSPWAIRLLPVADADITTTLGTLDQPIAPIAAPPSVQEALVAGLAFEGTDATGSPFGIFIARDATDWLNLWRLTGRSAPTALPSGSAAIGIFAGPQAFAGGRVFTGAVGRYDSAGVVGNAVVVAYAINPPTGRNRGRTVETPWAIRIVPGPVDRIFVTDMRADQHRPAVWDRPVATLIGGSDTVQTVEAVRRPPAAAPQR